MIGKYKNILYFSTGQAFFVSLQTHPPNQTRTWEF